MKNGTRKIKVLALKPTQFAFGLLEVLDRREKLERLGRRELKRLARKHPVAVVIAPNGAPYVVDGHHHAYLLWCLGIEKIYAQVVKDFSRAHLSYKKFWHEMKVRRWTHLYDQFGEGPREPVYLPPSVQGMADDPYRSLAWLAEREGGFAPSKDPFAQFQWANFFRKHCLLHGQLDPDFKAALTRALELCRSPAARRLPGALQVKAKRMKSKKRRLTQLRNKK